MNPRTGLVLLALCSAAVTACSSGPDCKGTSVLCNGACVELASDNKSCGACGNACSGGTSCVAAWRVMSSGMVAV